MATATELIISILAEANQANSQLDATTSKIKAVGDQATKLGQELTLKVTAPLTGMGALAFKYASDAEETLSKFNAVFGASSDQMRQKFEDLNKTIPATRSELLGMGANIQDLLVPMGLAPQEAQKMSLDIVKLAGDLASFNNIPVSVALDKIRAGLVGSYEPLLSFGVALNATSINQRAFNLGISDGKRELTASEKAQVAYKAILEGTTAAHGDAAKTADSSANSFKFLKANLEETATAFGKELLPIITPVIKEMTSLLKLLNDLDPSIKQAIVVTGTLAAAAGPLLIVIGSLARAYVSLQAALTIATTATTANTIATVANAEAATLAGTRFAAMGGVLSKLGIWGGIIAALGYEFQSLGEIAGETYNLINPPETAQLNLAKMAEAKIRAEAAAAAAAFQKMKLEADAAYARVQQQLDNMIHEGDTVGISKQRGGGSIELFGESAGNARLQEIIANVASNQTALANETASTVQTTGNQVAEGLQNVNNAQQRYGEVVIERLAQQQQTISILTNRVANMR